MMEKHALLMPKDVQNRNAAKVMVPVDIKRPLDACLQKQDARTLQIVRTMTIVSKGITAVSESDFMRL